MGLTDSVPILSLTRSFERSRFIFYTALVCPMVGYLLTVLLVALITAWWGTAFWLFSDLGADVEFFDEDDEASFHQACFNGMRRGIE